MTSFVFALEVFALTFIVGQAKISLPARTWFASTDFGGTPAGGWLISLLECNACAATHVGFWACLWGFAPSVFRVGLCGAIGCALFCCASSLILAGISGLNADGD